MNNPTRYEPKVEVVPSGHVLLTAQKQQEDFENWLGVVVKPCVRFRRLSNGKGLPLPAYATAGAAGIDLMAAEFALMYPDNVQMIGCGFAVEIPDGFVGLVFPRSSAALRRGLTLANTVGVIDSDYRGEVKLAVRYTSDSEICETIEVGDRIAQLLIAPVSRLKIEEAEQLSETERGAGGFGSTGS